MTRRRVVAVAVVAAALLVVCCALAVHEWRQPHVRTAGRVQLMVEGHRNPFRADSGTGAGLGGRLGLVGGRCVGFPEAGSVVVWPSGTGVERQRSRIRVTSGGRTVTVGDQVSGVTSGIEDPRWWRAHLPTACRDADLVGFGLG
jgi:hypothetical protein